MKASSEKRKITVLGMGPTAYERRINIEEYVADTEIWGLNNGYLSFPQLHGKWARFFELHKWSYLQTWDAGQGKDHFQELNALGCPVYVTEPIPLVLNQCRVNWVDVIRHHSCNYFLGSPSLMLMLALYEHDNGQEIEEIRSWGIDTSDPSHGQQRASWAFWIAQAKARGIEITGTALDFFTEYENDDGLRGLREGIGDHIVHQLNQQET